MRRVGCNEPRAFRIPVGEIDIVTRRYGTVVVIEVKVRSSPHVAIDAVTLHQCRRIENAASWPITIRDDLAACNLRFDLPPDDLWAWPHHLKDAWHTGD